MVDCCQHFDDYRGLSCHHRAARGRNRRNSLCWMASRLQRSRASRFRLAHQERGGFIWELLLGIVYVVAGIYFLINPITGMASLTLALAMYLLAEGILELIFSFRIRPVRGWGWLLFDAVITLILALIIWRTWPSNAAWVLGTLVGISMLFSGIARLMLSLAARRLVSEIA